MTKNVRVCRTPGSAINRSPCGRLKPVRRGSIGSAGPRPSPNRTAHETFGSPDDIKFRSSMTLFGAVSAQALFQRAVERFYEGIRDEATLAIMANWPSWDPPRAC